MPEQSTFNPFQVLGLPTTATKKDIVERRGELDTGAEQDAQMLHRWAAEELLTHPLTRLENELFEVPDTNYADPLFERFTRAFKRNPVRQFIDAPPGLDDIYYPALVQQLLDALLTISRGDLKVAIRAQPFSLHPDAPLGVRDVIF